MTNAATSPGPVPGNPYAVLVLTGSFGVERFSYPDPMDALVAAVRYLREGRQARLTDRTCAALREVPALAVFDRLMAGDLEAARAVLLPDAADDGVPFRAAQAGRGLRDA